MRLATLGLMGLALAGCSRGAFEDPLHPSGSRTLVVSQDRDAVHAVNVEEGTISTMDLATQTVVTTEVGGEPTRIARHGSRVFATLRLDGALAVLDETDAGLVLDRVLPLGAEPYGVVTTEDGKVYVSLSREDAVIGLDAETLEVFGRWTVPDEPRWLAVSAHDTVFVGCQKAGGIYQIDVAADEVTRLDVPDTHLLNAVREVTLTTRVTGDPAVSPDGRFLMVPVLEVDNQTTATEAAAAGNNTYYAEVTAGPGRFNPGAAVFGLDHSGRVARALPVLHAVAAVTGSNELPSVVRSFPSGIAISPSGEDTILAMEGSRSLVSLSHGDAERVNIFDVRTFIDHDEFDVRGFGTPPRAAVQTGNGPRSVVFVDDDTAVAHNWLDRSLVVFEPTFAYGPTGESNGALPTGVRIENTRFAPEIENGRNHFHTAVNDMMQAPGSGVSCATCHFDSREDGLSWPLEVGPRQTPTLVGTVSDTVPITWTGNVDSVATEVELTSQGRMGGAGASALVAADVAAYIDFTRQPQPSWSLDTAAVARGEAIFNRPEVGCAECHPAPSYTDGQVHTLVGGDAVNTPTLRGIAASAPYYHDGSRATLEDVLSTSAVGVMGDTSSLSAAEVADLAAFLKSL